MSARRAFVLGAIAGGVVLAAVGAVTAGSGSFAPTSVRLSGRPQGRAETVPPELLDDLKQLDVYLERALKGPERHRAAEVSNATNLKREIIGRYFGQSVNGGTARTAIKLFDCIDVQLAAVKLFSGRTSTAHNADGAERCKKLLINRFFRQPVYGVTLSETINAFDCIDVALYLAQVSDRFQVDVPAQVKAAKDCKLRLETRLKAVPPPPPQKVSISEDDTWAHNPAIGKSNICINVRTTPPQTSVSATLDGPSGYHSSLDKRPLDKPGTIQIKSEIAKAGDYTKTLTVYDATGKQTATVTKTFTVVAPPQDGPATTPPCPKPAQ